MAIRPARLWQISLLLAIVALLGACGASSSSKPSSSGSPAAGGGAATGSPIKIGVLADLTGEGAIEAAEIHVNTDLVVQQVNSSGGINGHPLQVTYVDPRADPAEAVNLATQLVQQDHVDLLLGGIFSSECLGIEQLAPRLGVVYMTATGCAAEDVTSKQCNKNTFRLLPVGPQLTVPLAKYMVDTYGKRWAILYPDYAFGQSQLQAYTNALSQVGGSITVKIPIPLGEANVTPYVTKIPTDGSIDGVIDSENGTDLSRVTAVIQQFGLDKKLPFVGSGGKEFFGGVYPDAVNGSLFATTHLSDPQPDNKFDQDYDKAFKAQVAKEGDLANILGGPSKAVSGLLGYGTYAPMNALKDMMRSSKFTGKADTEKLIAALETFSAPQSDDFPAGPVMMNKTDHQGRSTVYIAKISGQNENVLQTIAPDQIPAIGSCKV